MALQKTRTLENGMVANYHVITDVQFSKRGNALGIYWAGFKDEQTRNDKWQVDGVDNTDNVSVYTDKLFISGQDFIDNILPAIDTAGARTFCYNILKDRVDYLLNATDI
jgi:hypothetical protein